MATSVSLVRGNTFLESSFFILFPLADCTRSLTPEETWPCLDLGGSVIGAGGVSLAVADLALLLCLLDILRYDVLRENGQVDR